MKINGWEPKCSYNSINNITCNNFMWMMLPWQISKYILGDFPPIVTYIHKDFEKAMKDKFLSFKMLQTRSLYNHLLQNNTS